ncbi:hypothetical protein DY000_02011135 [Brassica cretica]|uniref:Ubiquitin-like domain-containing protein n=1 Tax=Brassica cretica TaxID=69181 RepID=A0ABQ7D0F2_BRACR|nr:hypothetical protein DY000_02011135 [Brassica cretica]
MRRNDKMSKVMERYTDARGAELGTYVFLSEGGSMINKDKTPDEMEIKDGDQIDAMLHQHGGFGTIFYKVFELSFCDECIIMTQIARVVMHARKNTRSVYYVASFELKSKAANFYEIISQKSSQGINFCSETIPEKEIYKPGAKLKQQSTEVLTNNALWFCLEARKNRETLTHQRSSFKKMDSPRNLIHGIQALHLCSESLTRLMRLEKSHRGGSPFPIFTWSRP